MTLLGRILAGAETRGSLSSPDATVLDSLGSTPSYSGQTVTVEGSMALIPVYSAVSLIAGAVGSLPMMVYRRVEGGRERAENHRMWPLLHTQPNPELAADEFFELLTTHLLLWGNAFVAKIRGPLGTVAELWPIRPNRVQVGWENGARYFILDGGRRYTEEDILHVRALGTDGLVGLSPIQQARQLLGNAKSLEEFSGKFWANSANPAGVLTHPNRLSPEAQKNLKGDWKQKYGGTHNAGEVAILEEGMKWETVSMPLEDAQFIETMRWTDTKVAQLYRLPAYMLNASGGDKSNVTYANVESQGIDFVRWSLRRWLVRFEQSLQRDPSLFVQGQRFYAEFLIDALLRADTKTRYDAYAVALNQDTGFMTRGEVRELENLLPEETPPAPPADDPTDTPVGGDPNQGGEPDAGN